MPQFQIQDMSCQHCETSISNAIKELDPQASIAIDLSQHLLTVSSNQNTATLEHAIREAGYTPVLLSAE